MGRYSMLLHVVKKTKGILYQYVITVINVVREKKKESLLCCTLDWTHVVVKMFFSIVTTCFDI